MSSSPTNNSFFRLARRWLKTAFALCFSLFVAIEPENLRGLLAVVSDTECPFEQRDEEQDESETVLISHVAAQRSQRRKARVLPRCGDARVACHAGSANAATPGHFTFSKCNGVSMPMRC